MANGKFLFTCRHTHISMEKAFLPKLWKLLRSGGNGSAEIIYPHFLPLISNWKVDIFGEKLPILYESFLQTLQTGLRSQMETQTSSRAELKAISTAYFECLKYILLTVQNVPVETFGVNMSADRFSLNLIQANIIDSLGALLEHSRNGRFVLTHLIDLIHFWCQTSETNRLHGTFETHFWTNAYSIIESALASSTNSREILDSVQEMVQIMFKVSQNHGKIKTAKIKFSDTTNQISADQIDGALKTQQASEKRSVFRTKTLDFVVQLSQLYIRNTSANSTAQYLPSLETFFTHLAGEGDFVEQITGSKAGVQQLCDQLCGWLNEPAICSERVLNMTLMLYAYVEPSAKINLLEKLVRSDNEKVADWMLLRLLTHPFCTEPEVQRLIAEPAVTANIVKNATALTPADVGAKINLLHKCFFQLDTGSFLIDTVTCQRIIDHLCAALVAIDTDVSVLDACVRFLAQIMPVICYDAQKTAIRNQMFVHLFGLCVDQRRLSTLSEDTVWEALTSWQDTLSSNDIQLDDVLLKSCADAVEKNVSALIGDEKSLISEFEAVTEVISKLVLCSAEHFEDEDELKGEHVDNVITSIFDKFNERYDTLRATSVRTSIFVELVNGRLKATPMIVNWLETASGSNDGVHSAQTLIKLAVFKFQTVFKMTCNVPNKRQSASDAQQNDEETAKNADEENTEDFCDLNEVLLKHWTQKIYAEVDETIYLAGLFSSYLQHFKVRGFL